MTTATKALPVRDDTYYPDSDGKPVGETARHVNVFRIALDHVERYYADVPDVYTGGNMFIYYERGNPRSCICPDLFVVKGVPKLREPERRSYRTWEENGKGPALVIEFTSKSTKKEDCITKKETYRDVLKVKEYFLFDPFSEYLKPPLQGFRLARGEYVAIKPVGPRMPSRVLGLQLERVGDLLRFWNPATQEYLPLSQEIEARYERTAAELRRAEAELERVRRELTELRRKAPE